MNHLLQLFFDKYCVPCKVIDSKSFPLKVKPSFDYLHLPSDAGIYFLLYAESYQVAIITDKKTVATGMIGYVGSFSPIKLKKTLIALEIELKSKS